MIITIPEQVIEFLEIKYFTNLYFLLVDTNEMAKVIAVCIHLFIYFENINLLLIGYV